MQKTKLLLPNGTCTRRKIQVKEVIGRKSKEELNN